MKTKLYERRRKLKLSQRAVSVLSGVSERTYSDHERGFGRVCPIPFRVAIAKALQCKPEDVFDAQGVSK